MTPSGGALPALDGSETVTVAAGNQCYRFFSRSARPAISQIERLIAEGRGCREAVEAAILESAASGHGAEPLIPLGQEIGFAAHLADRHITVAGVLQAMRRRIAADFRLAPQQQALAPRLALGPGT